MTALIAGAAVGIGLTTFVYAEGAAYLSDDPNACANCHVMQAQLDGWSRSSHHTAATCNDCHLPHDFAGRWLVKAGNGVRHSFAFTTGAFHEPIRIGDGNRAVVERACRSCHAPIVDAIDHPGTATGALACARCHPDVGHAH